MKNRKRNAKAERLRKELEEPRTVHVRSHSYQPKLAEKLEAFRINATPEELADAVLRPVRVIEDQEA
ncbi:MAG: hypothetical protein OXH76_00580 [Boseongicola sp.]|nr:hypothetical protein [Boseongicola sp.]